MFLEGEIGSLSCLQGVCSLPRRHGHLGPHCLAPPWLDSSPPEPLPAALLRARYDSLSVLLGTFQGLPTGTCPSPQVTWLQPVTLGIPIYTLATWNSSPRGAIFGAPKAVSAVAPWEAGGRHVGSFSGQLGCPEQREHREGALGLVWRPGEGFPERVSLELGQYKEIWENN